MKAFADMNSTKTRRDWLLENCFAAVETKASDVTACIYIMMGPVVDKNS